MNVCLHLNSSKEYDFISSIKLSYLIEILWIESLLIWISWCYCFLWSYSHLINFQKLGGHDFFTLTGVLPKSMHELRKNQWKMVASLFKKLKLWMLFCFQGLLGSNFTRWSNLIFKPGIFHNRILMHSFLQKEELY